MDYAWGNRAILKNGSFFLLPWREGGAAHPVLLTMQAIAPVRFYRNSDEREGILREEGADFFYCVKNGFNDGVFSRRVPTGIHAIFRESEFHGDVYAYISGWLSRVMSHGRAAVAPWMVRLAEETGDLRAEARIPPEAMVWGRHGGEDSFDIPWVQQVVAKVARENPTIRFLFLNTREFPEASGVPNIHFLPATSDPVRKRAFLNTCDAMIHGRQRGETLGMACLECASLGKTVLTYGGSPEVAHLEVLGESAVKYESPEQLLGFLRQPESILDRPTFKAGGGPQVAGRTTPFQEYQPAAAMRKFEEVFLR